MIIGSDLMKEVKIDILYSTGEVQLDDVTIPLKPKDIHSDEDVNQQWFEENFESLPVRKAMKRFLDNDYKAANLEETVAE